MQKIVLFLALLITMPLTLFAQLIELDQPSVSNSSTCDHSRQQSRTSFTPTLRYVLTPCKISQQGTFSLLGEIGVKNFRLNGTLGMEVVKNNRAKVSVDYLVQQLGYNFSSGRTYRTVDQFAIAGTYDFFIDLPWINNVEGTVFYSRACGQTLKSVTCPGSSTLSRHIAGGRDYGLSFGGYALPWKCARAGVFAYYDFVMFKRKFSKDRVVQGPGIAFLFGQKLFYSLEYDCRLEFRTPFCYYSGLLNWNSNYFRRYGDFKMGVFGSYTSGNSGLPSCSCIGIQLTFSFGACNPCLNNCVNTCDCYNPCTQDCYKKCPDLCDWAIQPAVYVPEVMAITEQN